MFNLLCFTFVAVKQNPNHIGKQKRLCINSWQLWKVKSRNKFQLIKQISRRTKFKLWIESSPEDIHWFSCCITNKPPLPNLALNLPFSFFFAYDHLQAEGIEARQCHHNPGIWFVTLKIPTKWKVPMIFAFSITFSSPFGMQINSLIGKCKDKEYFLYCAYKMKMMCLKKQ